MEILKVVVIGAGTMGQGIAQVAAMFGYQTLLYDQDAEKTNHALLSIHKILAGMVVKQKLTAENEQAILVRLSVTTNIKDCIGDLLIEAIVENVTAKQNLFGHLERLNSPTSLLVSNTSSLSIAEIAATLTHKERFAGLHFFNPAPLMQLVEVINGPETSITTIDTLNAFVLSLKKVAVCCEDSPGFIVNRVARPFYTESLKIAEEGAASIPDIDKLLTSAGFKKGPFELMDLIGNDINYAVTTSLYNAFGQEPRFRPSRLQQKKVLAKHFGKKSGKGFYNY